MADFKKVIDILANTKSAEKDIKSLLSTFDMSAKQFSKKFSSEFAEAFETAQPLLKKYFDAIREKNAADALGIPDAMNKAQEAVNKFKQQLNDDAIGASILAKIDEINAAAAQRDANLAEKASQDNAANEAAQAAKSANDALFAFSGLSSTLNDIVEKREQLADIKGLDPKLVEAATKTLDAQEAKLTALANAQAKLNALELAGEGKSKEAKATRRDIAKLSNKTFSADMKTFRDDVNPFSKKNLEKFKDNGKYNTVLGAGFAKVMSAAIKKIGSLFVDTFKNAFKNLAEMGTYNAGSSLISNRSAREQQLTFGLSGAQNYAMTNAMKMMGMSGIEDLFWMNAKQQTQYNKMTSILEAQYNKLESSGIMETTQQFQLDMAMMKMQFQNTVYQFIAAHKGALEKVLDMALTFMEGVLEFLGWIADGIGAMWGGNGYASSDSLAAASTTSSTTNTDNSRTISATINYTNNQSENESGNAISESVLNQLIAVLNG